MARIESASSAALAALPMEKHPEAHSPDPPTGIIGEHETYQEPVFMILGQSAATAAALAIDGEISVQDFPYPTLEKRLLGDGQILSK